MYLTNIETYRIHRYTEHSPGFDAGLGLTETGEFICWNAIDASQANEERRSMQYLSPCFIVEAYCVFSVGFAAASTNTLIIQTGAVHGTLTTPADSITITITASTTGKFSNTGRTFIGVDIWTAWLFTSDDATDPATLNDKGVLIEPI